MRVFTNEKNWNREEIIKIVAGIARIEIDNIADESLIRDELGIDSLMAIEIIAKIEKRFDVEIEESVLLNMNTVGDFINVMERKIA